MKADERQEALENVCREIGRIAAGGGTFQDITKTPDFRAYTPAPPDARLKDEGRTKTHEERGPFGRWLLAQPATGRLTPLINGAKNDPKFPRNGDPEDVRARLRACQAEGYLFEMVDDAELDWASF